MRILIVHQYYLLPGQSGGSRFNEMARLWSEAGHEVTVVAGTINYATGRRPEKYARRWITRERDGVVKVLRCYVPRTYNKSYIGRAWAFVGFAASACCAVLTVSSPDVIVASSPPLTVALPGRLASLAHRAPLVFEVRDLWPESAITTGVISRTGRSAQWLYRLERWAYRRSSLVNVLTSAFRDDLLARKLVPDSRIITITNGADDAMLSSVTEVSTTETNEIRRAFGWRNRIVALYAGAHGKANSIGQLVDAAANLRSRPDILIATVGDGPEREQWQRQAQAMGLENIQFHGAQPKERMPTLLRAADIGLAVLQNNPTFRTVYPNKVFDYMACARPTILAIDGIARRLVCDEARAGLYAEPENGVAIAKAIAILADDSDMRRHLGNNGRKWVLTNATRQGLAARYQKHLEELVGNESRSGKVAENRA